MRFCGHCGARIGAEAPPGETVYHIAETEAQANGAAAPPTPEVNAVRVAASGAVAGASVSAIPDRSPEPRLAPSVPSSSARPALLGASAQSADLIARERECDRLLSRANVQRMRAQIIDARKTLDEALVRSEGLPGKHVSPIYEMIGDMAAAEERWEQAANAYEMAHRLDPARLTAEKKFGEMAIRLADETAMASLAQDDTMAELAHSARGKRNPGIALILSLVVPGFGQFYNGDFLKGALFLIAWVLALILGVLSPGAAALKCLILPAKSCQGMAAPMITWLCIAVSAAAWLVSLIEAPMAASRTEDRGLGNVGIDKTGWEV